MTRINAGASKISIGETPETTRPNPTRTPIHNIPIQKPICNLHEACPGIMGAVLIRVKSSGDAKSSTRVRDAYLFSQHPRSTGSQHGERAPPVRDRALALSLRPGTEPRLHPWRGSACHWNAISEGDPLKSIQIFEARILKLFVIRDDQEVVEHDGDGTGLPQRVRCN